MSLARMDTGLRTRLEELLGRLPVREDRRDAIRFEAEKLYLAAGFGSGNDLPRAKNAGSAMARRELHKLEKLALALATHIRGMHRDAFEAIDSARGRGRSLLLLADDIVDLHKVVEQIQTIKETSGRSLHSKGQAKFLTDSAAFSFRYLTGKEIKRASKSSPINANLYGSREAGEFHDFLAGLFKLLCIDASAAGQIKLWTAEKARQKKAS